MCISAMRARARAYKKREKCFNSGLGLMRNDILGNWLIDVFAIVE